MCYYQLGGRYSEKRVATRGYSLRKHFHSFSLYGPTYPSLVSNNLLKFFSSLSPCHPFLLGKESRLDSSERR